MRDPKAFAVRDEDDAADLTDTGNPTLEDEIDQLELTIELDPLLHP